VYPSVLKMETLILASHDSPNWSIVSILAWKQITLLSINVEFNFSGFNVNVGICGTQEGSPKNERNFMSSYISSTTKSIGIKKFWIFTEIFLAIHVG
jgi:hypothetical protein